MYDRTKKHGARRTIERKKHQDYELWACKLFTSTRHCARKYTLFKMADNTLFLCLHVNWPSLLRLKPKTLLNSADANVGQLTWGQKNKCIFRHFGIRCIPVLGEQLLHGIEATCASPKSNGIAKQYLRDIINPGGKRTWIVCVLLCRTQLNSIRDFPVIYLARKDCTSHHFPSEIDVNQRE